MWPGITSLRTAHSRKFYPAEECQGTKRYPAERRGCGQTETRLFQTLNDAGYPDTVLRETKDLSISQIEKIVGKKEFTELAKDLVVKQPGAPALVPESDKRPALEVVKAVDVFSKEDNGGKRSARLVSNN